MNRKRALWFALIPVIALIWAMKSAASWRPQFFVIQEAADFPWLSTDDRSMAVETVSNAGGFWMWDVDTRRLLWKSRSGDYSLSMSPDSRFIVLAHAPYPLFYPLQSLSKVQFELHDERTGQLVRILEKCEFAGKDKFLSCNYTDKNEFVVATKFFVRRWNTTTGKLIVTRKWAPLKDSSGLTSSEYISEKDQFVAFDKGSGIVFLDATTGQQVRRLPNCLASTNPIGPDNFLQVSPDEYSFYEVSDFQQSGRVFRLSDGALLWRTSQWPTFDNDGKRAYVPTSSGNLSSANSGLDVFDAHTGRKTSHLPGPSEYGFGVSSDGNYLYEARAGKIFRWRAR